jgi:hypothetical protein
MGYLTLNTGARAIAAGMSLTERSLRGDQNAIAQLISWHASNNDPEKAASWTRVLWAEPGAMAELAQELNYSADPERRAYTGYWLARANAGPAELPQRRP